MKTKLITTILLSASALIPAMPAQAQIKPSQIGPSITFGGGTTVFGVDSRFPIAPNFSIRPNVRFPSGGVIIGTAATYDFDISGSDRMIEPYAGIGVSVYTGDNTNNGTNVSGYLVGGVDYSLSDQFTLNGNVAIPFSSGYSTNFTIGVGYKF